MPDLITIMPVAGHADLHCQYTSELHPQPCFVELDPTEGTLHCEYDTRIGPGTVDGVHNGRIFRWAIPCLTADAANDLMDRILPLAKKIQDGFSLTFDGPEGHGVREYGRLTADASDANEAIEHMTIHHAYKDDADIVDPNQERNESWTHQN